MDTAYLTNGEMRAEDYRQYLREVCYYEKNIFLIDQSIQRLNDQMPDSGISGYVSRPVGRTEESGSPAFVTLFSSVWTGFIPISIISLIIFLYSEILWAAVIAFFALHAAWFAIVSAIAASGRRDRNRAVREANAREQADYEEAVRQGKERRELEELQRQSLLRDISTFEIDRSICAQALAQLYSCNILHPKYRNFVAVSSIYEYFDTGRCSALEGSGGAYDIYERESRLDKIISRLDQALDTLELIRQNQEMLYFAVRDAQGQAEALTSETIRQISSLADRTDAQINRLAENQRLLEYNTRIAAESAETMKHIVLYKERVGGVLPVSYPKLDH